MKNKILKKLRSQTGASITFALLLFPVCAVLCSVIIVAATASAGRMSGIAEADQRYYAVSSAAELLQARIDGKTVSIVKVEETEYETTYTAGVAGEPDAGESETKVYIVPNKKASEIDETTDLVDSNMIGGLGFSIGNILEDSTKYTTNSLFGSINDAKDTAYIGSIRHLENLDKKISNLDANDGTGTNDKIIIAHAEQTDSFSWVDFQKAVKKIESKSTTGTESVVGYESVCVYDFSGTNSGAGCYMPIEPDYALTYNGKSRSISDVAVNVTGDGGLFGSISSVTEIKNLELIDFYITGTASAGALGTASAGALAGTLSGCTVTNVLARNSAATSAAKITATGNAGGLVGELTSGTVQYSAAAVIVGDSSTKPTNAGGLIGSAGGTITGCYSGGHTKNGSYEEWVTEKDAEDKLIHSYDVTGTTAGGLVGISSAAITDSYSTCSVSGTTAGGFAGNASGSINNCYVTGYIDPNATTKFAFVAGALPSGSTGNWYYSMINEVEKTGGKDGETEPMLPYLNAGEVSTHLSSVKPIDLNAGSYNVFVGEWDTWNPARAFDSALVKYYSGSYTLKTVDELNATLSADYSNWHEIFVSTHYGDWPSPEVFFINTNTSA